MPKSEETNLITAFVEQMKGLRQELKDQNKSINDKLDAQTKENREEFRDIRNDLAEVREGMAKGSERMENMRRDIGKLENAPRCDCNPSAALERKQMEATTEISSAKKIKISWWQMILIGGALTYLGEKAVKVLINSLADPPAASQSKP